MLRGHKGLDDLHRAGQRPRWRALNLAPLGIGEPRRPCVLGGAGPVDRGMTLERARRLTTSAVRAFVRKRTENAGKALLVSSSPGVGKTAATRGALGDRPGEVRLLVGTKALARELSAEHGYLLIEGRNATNCERMDVVTSLGEGGHPVEPLACGTPSEPRCPFRSECRYYGQFSHPGPAVAAVEQLYNAHFLRGATLLVLDDADLLRAMVRRAFVPLEALSPAAEMMESDSPIGAVLRLLQHAVVDGPASSLDGAAVWDHLAGVALRNGIDLATVIASLPERISLPGPEADAFGEVTAAAVAAVPPAHVGRILRALIEEWPAFVSGEEFNSRLRLNNKGVEVGWLREHLHDPSTGRSFVSAMAMLVLDATPLTVMVDHLTGQHERLPDVEAIVELPANVQVVQYATGGNGHMSLAEPTNLARVMTEIARERSEHPVADPSREGVICYKELVSAIVDAGATPGQVMTFGSVRGSNALAQVERLHIVGRPWPPGTELTYLAQIIHHDGPPLERTMVLRDRWYGGRPDGIAVLDYADERISALLKAARDDELIQVIHRARLHLLPAQAEFAGGRSREHVRLVIHTTHPPPGVRVGELIVPEPGAGWNERVKEEATERIIATWERLRAEGVEPTMTDVAREARANSRTVKAALGTRLHARIGGSGPDRTDGAVLGNEMHTHKEDLSGVGERDGGLGTELHTPKKISLMGVQTVPQTLPDDQPVAPAPYPSHWQRCPGGCGVWMPPYQTCFHCAAAATIAWRIANRRKPPEALASDMAAA